ncbi:MAG: T9SS type A sorting domain-containing protein [Bacteroidetes bacterium]|nr:T9SS type A sorting domain-containing protein [Bacteroidota bacterium]
MKTNFITLLLILLCGNLMNAQTIPTDSLYLGQTLPGNVPQIFHLAVAPGSFAAERIAISNDNKELFYSGIHNYYPITGDTVRYYRYTADHWTGPFNLFNDYCAPALTVSGDTMFIQNPEVESFYSIKSSAGWTNPQRFLSNLNTAHYVQVTNNGNYYTSSIPDTGIGAKDWCRLDLNMPDSAAVSLGLPLNTTGDNLDFFVPKDESFMILSKGGMKISYHKDDGNWTNPKSLGDLINFGSGNWGPYVSADNKYLFYTTGILPDYSDTYVYWVRIDSLMDSLRYTNYVPYLKNFIPQQYGYVGQQFTFTIPDSTFIDDDGNNTLTYSAKLTNGSPLPGWLSFDSITAAFSGKPNTIQSLNIRIKATDDAGAFIYTIFKIVVLESTSIPSRKAGGIRVFPNPTSGKLNILIDNDMGRTTLAEILSLEGKLLKQKEFNIETSFDLSDVPKGIYLLKAKINDEMIFKKICLE